MKHSFKSNSSSIRELESRRRVTWKGAVLTLQPRDAPLLRSVDAKCRQGFTRPLLLRFPFSRVTVKHPSLRWLPVPGRLVCKLYEIPPPPPPPTPPPTPPPPPSERRGMMLGRRKRRREGDEEAECEIKCRAVNVMYRHRHQSHSVIFIPLSSNQ